MMCVDPVSMGAGLAKSLAAIKTTLGGLSTAMSIGGGVVSAASAVNNARVQRQVAQRNAEALTQAAQQSLEAGQEASDRQRRAGAAALSRQKASMAANGVDVGSADAMSILDETAMFTAEDAFAIRRDATRKAQDLSQGAANELTSGNAAYSDGLSSAFKTILTTGASVGEKYRHWVADGSRKEAIYN